MFSLHTHTFYCQHGEGTVEEYRREAERLGFSMLGFSEHIPFPDDRLTANKSRMFYRDRENYERDVRLEKSRSSVPVFLGYECDWLPDRKGYVESLRESTDYLILGVHFLTGVDGATFTPFRGSEMWKPGNLRIYTDGYIDGLRSGLFLYGCHPDVYMCKREAFGPEEKAAAIDILSAAKDLGIPLEVNANGIFKAHNEGKDEYMYPRLGFWEIASEMGIKVVIGPDAHSVENLSRYNGEAEAFARKLGLEVLEPSLEDGRLILG